MNRREFLATPAVAFSPKGANDRINVGVIGTGGRGTHLLNLVLARAKEVGDVQVVAVCDVYQKRLDNAAKLAGGVKQYTYHPELLDRTDLDAVFIATPDHWHAPITMAALDRSLDVYCEKPVTLTAEQSFAVAKKAAQTGRILQVGVQSMSWNKWHKAKEAIAQGMLGKVVCCHGTYSRNAPGGDWNWDIDPGAGPDGKAENHVDWKQWLGPATQREWNADRFFRFRKYWDYSGGIATDLHYHTVAPFHLAVANEYPTRVVGMGGLWVAKDGREVPDTYLNSADYPSEWSVIVQSSQANAHGPITMIRGEHATMLMGEDWEGRDSDVLRIVPEKPFAKDWIAQFGKPEIVIPGAGNEGDRKHVDNFFECVRSRQQPNCDADTASKVMTHIGLSVQSYREGKMFHFDPVNREIRASSETWETRKGR